MICDLTPAIIIYSEKKFGIKYENFFPEFIPKFNRKSFGKSKGMVINSNFNLLRENFLFHNFYNKNFNTSNRENQTFIFFDRYVIQGLSRQLFYS
jgi:hypothetical protein